MQESGSDPNKTTVRSEKSGYGPDILYQVIWRNDEALEPAGNSDITDADNDGWTTVRHMKVTKKDKESSVVSAPVGGTSSIQIQMAKKGQVGVSSSTQMQEKDKQPVTQVTETQALAQRVTESLAMVVIEDQILKV